MSPDSAASLSRASENRGESNVRGVSASACSTVSAENIFDRYAIRDSAALAAESHLFNAGDSEAGEQHAYSSNHRFQPPPSKGKK